MKRNRTGRGSPSRVGAVLVGMVGTLIVTMLVLNLSSGERKINHRIPHLYSVADPQFARSMGALMGAPLLAG
jgi:cardiolipin synthase